MEKTKQLLMKSKEVIERRIFEINLVVEGLKVKYDHLDQYSMQGNEGYQLQEQINKLSGKLEALKWVITT